MLRAYELGLGTCWVGAFDEGEVARILELPQNIKPVAVVTVGYPNESPQSNRLSVEEVAQFVQD